MPNSGHRTRVVILGAAGRDFHNFNAVCREDRSMELITFTAGLMRLNKPIVRARYEFEELEQPGLWDAVEELLERPKELTEG